MILMQHHLDFSKSFSNVFDRDIGLLKISSRYTTKHGFLIMQLLQRPTTQRLIDRLAKQSSEYEKIRYIKKVQIIDVLIWIELDLETHNKVNFYQFKHYPDNNEKSRWKKVASKEITLEEFPHSESSVKRRVI